MQGIIFCSVFLRGPELCLPPVGAKRANLQQYRSLVMPLSAQFMGPRDESQRVRNNACVCPSCIDFSTNGVSTEDAPSDSSIAALEAHSCPPFHLQFPAPASSEQLDDC